MSKDITIIEDSVKLNFRTAMLIYHKGNVLLHKAKDEDFWNMPGGRVQFGEDSLSAVKREMQEELDVKIDNAKFVGFFENFFVYAGIRYQELLTVYSCELPDCELTKKQDFVALDNHNMEYHWHKKEDVKHLKCLPQIIYNIVDKNTDNIVHDITKND